MRGVENTDIGLLKTFRMVGWHKVSHQTFLVDYCVATDRRRRDEFLSLFFRERDGDSSALNSLQQYLDKELQGAHVHACAQCVEEEVKPTIRFYQDVTKYAIDSRVKAIRDVNDAIANDPLDIREVFRSF